MIHSFSKIGFREAAHAKGMRFGFATSAPKPLAYYYKVLGVKPGFTSQELKSAYLEMVKKHHPDLSKAPDASQRFQEIQIAYDVLQEAAKRNKQEESQTLFNERRQKDPKEQGNKEAASEFDRQFRESYTKKRHVDETMQFSYNLYKKHFQKVQSKKKDYVKYETKSDTEWAHKDEKGEPIWKTLGVGAAMLGLATGAIYFVNMK